MSDKKSHKTPQDFVKAYDELCKEYGYQLVPQPVFKGRDDGTWSVILQITVQPFKNDQK